MNVELERHAGDPVLRWREREVLAGCHVSNGVGKAAAAATAREPSNELMPLNPA
jgi:hypothetical protein